MKNNQVSIISYLNSKDSSLKNIAISRRKNIEWLFVVAEKLNCKTQTLFNSVFMFDMLNSCVIKEINDAKNLHLLIVVCFIISFKVIEGVFISMDVIEKNILHEKFTRNEIKEAELYILFNLNYKVMYYTSYDFYSVIINNIDKKYDEIRNASLSLLKSFQLDDNFSFQHKPYDLACLSVKLSIKSFIDQISLHNKIDLRNLINNIFSDIDLKSFSINAII